MSLASPSFADMTQTEGGCVNCYIPDESVLKIPNTAFVNQLMPQLIRTANLNGELQKAAPMSAPELKRIGPCTGAEGLTTCTLFLDPCMVITSAHLFASNEQLENLFVATASGKEKDLKFTEVFNDTEENPLGIWQTNGKDSHIKKEVFQFFIDRDPKTGIIDNNKSFLAERFVYVNAYCDTAIVKLKPDKNGQCPGEVNNRGFFKLPTDSLASKVIQNSNDLTQKKEATKMSALAYYGFPEAAVRSDQKETNLLQVGLIKQYQTRFLKDNTELNKSQCMLTEHISNTGKGNSGSPYVFIEGKNDPLKDRNQISENYDIMVGLHSGNKSGNYNSGYLFTPEYMSRIRKAVEQDNAISAKRKTQPEQIATKANKGTEI